MQEYKIVVQGTRKIITYLKSYLKIPFKLYYFAQQEHSQQSQQSHMELVYTNIEYIAFLGLFMTIITLKFSAYLMIPIMSKGYHD